MKVIKSKPCPFCGSNKLGTQWDIPENDIFPTATFCRECDARGPWIKAKSYNKESEARKAWNKRAKASN